MKTNEPAADEIMNYKGLSAYLKMAQGTLRHKVMGNSIPYYKIGKNVRFSKTLIEKWLAEHQREAKVKKPENNETGGGVLPDESA
ncbi:MAG: helix-turn-helix domain-containing protein [Treponema sp.]|nr:helix-turn-helix domain-containing protein [Treponema sp.]